MTDIGLTPRQSALTAAISLLLMAVIAPIATFQLLGPIQSPDAANRMAEVINGMSGTFRAAVGLLLFVILLDVLVSWALYIFFRPVNRALSLLAAWVRLVYAAMFAGAVFFLLLALHASSAGSTGIRNALAGSAIQTFQDTWQLGLAIFGVHLLLLGILAWKAGALNKVLGPLLALAGLGYTIDAYSELLSLQIPIKLAVFTFVGEIVLMVWLFFQGRTGKGQPGQPDGQPGASV